MRTMTMNGRLGMLLTVSVVGLLMGTASTAESLDASPVANQEVPLCQRILTGADSARVAELEQEITKLREAARYSEAVPLAKEVHGTRQLVQGTDHWEVKDALDLVQTLRHIASLPPQAQVELAEVDRSDTTLTRLHAQNQFEETLHVAATALDVRRKYLTSTDPELAASINDLGLFSHYIGKYHEAEVLYREALKLNRAIRGLNHPHVAVTMYNLAILLHDKTEYEASEQFHREALAIQRALFGDTAPAVLWNMNFLAITLYNSGNYEKAQVLHRETLSLWREAYGQVHRGTAESLSGLGAVLRDRGKIAQSEVVCREALAIRRALLGDNDPEVAESLLELAWTLEAKGSSSEAEALLREGASILRAISLDTRLNDYRIALARLISRKDDVAATERILKEAIADVQARWGDYHPYITSVLEHQGLLLAQKGDFVAAESLLRRAEAIAREGFRVTHLNLATALGSLGSLLMHAGKYSEAEKCIHEELDIQRTLVGDDAPSLTWPLDALGSIAWRTGDYASAESLWTLASSAYHTARLMAGLSGLERGVWHSTAVQDRVTGAVWDGFGLCQV